MIFIHVSEPLLNDTICLGEYDDKYYRIKILNKNGKEFKVKFIDYGNDDYLQIK